MSRWLAPLLAILLLLGLAPHSQAQIDIPTVTIGGGDLPNPVTLSAVDADAFRRRVNLPPRLEDPPDASGTAYTVTSPYWDGAVKREDDAEEKLDVADGAAYYPQGGYVHTRLGDQDVWLVIDLRQRAILDHYIQYSKLQLQRLPSNPDFRESVTHPSALLMMFLGYYGVGEPVGIQLGSQVLTQSETDAYLASIAPNFYPVTYPSPPQPPSPEASPGYWVTITLAEGRSLRYFYDSAKKTLTADLGTEMIQLNGNLPTPSQDGAIQQQTPAGSRWWWPVMIGGGLAAIGAALWWQLRMGRR